MDDLVRLALIFIAGTGICISQAKRFEGWGPVIAFLFIVPGVAVVGARFAGTDAMAAENLVREQGWIGVIAFLAGGGFGWLAQDELDRRTLLDSVPKDDAE